MYKILVILFTVFSVIACAKKAPPEITIRTVEYKSENASIKLAEAATSVSRSLNELARIQTAANGPIEEAMLVNPTIYGLQTRTSVDWSGPVGQLVKQIADASEFKLRIIGKEPTIPVLVKVSAEDATLADVLRDIDYQVMNKAAAHIAVYPKERIIELRYVEV